MKSGMIRVLLTHGIFLASVGELRQWLKLLFTATSYIREAGTDGSAACGLMVRISVSAILIRRLKNLQLLSCGSLMNFFGLRAI